MDIRFLYVDESLVVCEKPVGISSESPGLPDLIREQQGFAVFPVHRLDQTTGGAMVLARAPAACAALQREFQEDRVIKEYLAVVSGVPETDSGLFSDLLYHDQRSNKTFVVDNPRKGVKEASCEWTVVETAEAAEGKISLIRVRLHSGRTHQIRVQFASRGMPLLGDARYGSSFRDCEIALYAAALRFAHPVGQRELSFNDNPPDSFPWGLFGLHNS